MKNRLVQISLTLLACAAVAACSEKIVTPAKPAAPAVQPAAPVAATAAAPVVAAAPAPAAEPSAPPVVQSKQAALECEDRKIELKADCVDLYGPRMLQCTSQVLTVSEKGAGKLNERIFPTSKSGNEDPDTVEEKIGDISCVRSKAGDKYIVTSMFNGGNCEECEWFEVYDWTGKQIGSTRDRKKKNPVVDEVVGHSVKEPAPENMFGKEPLDKFYSGVEDGAADKE